jgi:HEAT repeat protein
MSDPTGVLADLFAAVEQGDETAAEKALLLLSHNPRRAYDALLLHLIDPDAEIRWWTVYALSTLGDMRCVPHLLNALGDVDEGVRQCAALGLSHLPDPRAVPALVDVLGSDDRMLARLGTTALIAIGKDAVPALIDVMQGENQPARMEAVRALAEIKDERAIATFFTAIRDGDTALVEYWSDIGLDKLGVGMSFFDPT